MCSSMFNHWSLWSSQLLGQMNDNQLTYMTIVKPSFQKNANNTNEMFKKATLTNSILVKFNLTPYSTPAAASLVL